MPHALSAPVSGVLGAIGRYYRPPHPQQATLANPEHSPDLREKQSEEPAPGTLQIAVAIAMPSPTSSLYFNHGRYSGDWHEKTTHTHGPEPLPDVSLGFAKVRSIMPVL